MSSEKRNEVEGGKEHWRASRRWYWVAVALPVVLWFVGSLFFLGDLGKYSDDWTMSLRMPETGVYDGTMSPFIRWNYFWRPLHLAVIYTSGTVFWDHDWVNHVVTACAHGVVGVMLYLLLRRLGVGWRGASAGAVVYLCCPVLYEAPIWPAAIGTPLGVATLLGVGLMVVVWGRDSGEIVARGSTTRSKQRVVARLGLLFLAAFCVPCWNEQPAVGLAALPLLVMAGVGTRDAGRAGTKTPTAQSRGRWHGGEWNRFWARVKLAVVVGVVVCAAPGVYLALLLGTAPAGRRGGTESVVDAAGALERVGVVYRAAWSRVFGERGWEMMSGSFENGLSAMSSWWGVVVGFVVLGAAGVWVVAWMKKEVDCVSSTRSTDFAQSGQVGGTRSGDTGGQAASGTGGLWWVALFGFAVMAMAFLPIAAVNSNNVHSRYFCLAVAGLGVVLGCGVEGLGRMGMRRGEVGAQTPSSRGRWHGRVGAALVATAIAVGGMMGAVCLVGWQANFRERSRRDFDQIAQLRALVGTPARNAVFVPMLLEDRSAATGIESFDRAVLGAMEHPWACWALVQRGFARSDVTATHLRRNLEFALREFSDGSARVKGGVWLYTGRIDWPRNRVKYEDMVPFTVDAEGKVRLVGSLTVRRKGAEDRVVEFDAVKRALRRIEGQKTAGSESRPTGRELERMVVNGDGKPRRAE